MRSFAYALAVTAPVTSVVCAQTQPDYEKAMALVREGKVAVAMPLIEGLVKREPENLKARNLLGIALSSSGKREEAVDQFRRILERDPNLVAARKNLALNELELGRIEAAKANFEAALKLAPKDFVSHFGLAQAEFASARYAEAVEHYEQSNGMYMRDPATLVRYATAAVRSGAADKALQALGQVPIQADGAVHLEAGVLYAAIERYGDAVREFERAHVNSPDPYKSGFNLTLAYLKTKKYAEAVRTGRELIAKGHESAELYELLGQALEGAGQTKEAYEALRSAIRIQPTGEGAYADLIALCLQHENYELSLEISEIGVRANPSSSRIRLQRGIVLALMSRFDEAEKEFDHAIKIAPDAPLGHVVRGLLLLRTDRITDAVALLRKRSMERPGDYLANWLLGEALVRAGNAEQEAVTALERSIKAQGAFPQARALLGKLLLQRGDAEQAILHLDKALELDPGRVTAMYQLAQAYRKKGDAGKAAELLAKVGKAKEEDPAHFPQRNLLRIIREEAARPNAGK